MRSSRWRRHLGEVFVRISGETHCLWRAVGHDGEVLEALTTTRRDREAALKTPRKTDEAQPPAGTDRHRQGALIQCRHEENCSN
ncbi:MAG: transposase [Roseovarius sp.]|nr:transposase [Roseovarius sp.]